MTKITFYLKQKTAVSAVFAFYRQIFDDKVIFRLINTL